MMGTVSVTEVSPIMPASCLACELLNLPQAVQTAEQVHSPQTSASDTDHAPSSQDTAEHNTVDLSGQLFAQLSAEEDKLPHARASMSAIPALLESALFVALTRSLFGINFLQQWIWPQVCPQASHPACQHNTAWLGRSALHTIKVDHLLAKLA